MSVESISLDLARRLALRGQLLDRRTELPPVKEGAARVVEMLGYVQIDTIAAVERAHHHVLWTRCAGYEPAMLEALQALDRRVFEYWGHALSYLPMSDYRYYVPRMQALHDPKGKWEKGRLHKYGHLAPPMLERIRQEGPLSSKDFATPPEARTGGKDVAPPRAQVRFALELLLLRGDLMVTERRKNQRIYDLTERVLPPGVDTTAPDEDDLGRFLVRRALSAYGVATEREVREHIDAADGEVIAQALVDLVEAGEVAPVEVEGDPGTEQYALSGDLERAAGLGPVPSLLQLLSPFDNLIIQRERVQRLFGFAYALECYTPPAKRKYGYFVLPLLWGERFVGRLDPKADRKKGVLSVRNLVLEPDFAPSDEFLAALAVKLAAFARFNGCEAIQFEQVTPADVRVPLERLVEGA
jgi:uncharacterized protein YcaQ